MNHVLISAKSASEVSVGEARDRRMICELNMIGMRDSETLGQDSERPERCVGMEGMSYWAFFISLCVM